jgi:hypothetical protein
MFSSPKFKLFYTRCRWYDRWCSPILRPHHPFPVSGVFAARMLVRSASLIHFLALPCFVFRWRGVVLVRFLDKLLLALTRFWFVYPLCSSQICCYRGCAVWFVKWRSPGLHLHCVACWCCNSSIWLEMALLLVVVLQWVVGRRLCHRVGGAFHW